MVRVLRHSLRLSDRAHRGALYRSTFVAHEAVEWLVHRFDLSRSGAVELCEALRSAGLIHAALPALRERPFASDLAFFQFSAELPVDAGAAEPEAVGSVQRVELQSLGLRALPEWLARATAVETLTVRYNELRTLPAAALHASISVLDVGHNALTALPAALGELRQLRRLRVDGNLLRELPAALGACGQLRSLLANDNPLLERVPPELALLARSLEVLQLNDTRVSILPAALKALTSLTELSLDADFMRFPPADVCALDDVAAVLKYLARNEADQPKLPVVDYDSNDAAAPAAAPAVVAEDDGDDDGDDSDSPLPPPPLPAEVPPPAAAVVAVAERPERPGERAPELDAEGDDTGELRASQGRGARQRVQTLGTSHMRPSGPAPDPSVPQPWTELSDDEDAASAALFQWATNARSTERLFQSGMKKFERGKLAPLQRCDPVPVEAESAPIEPVARNKWFRNLATAGGGGGGGEKTRGSAVAAAAAAAPPEVPVSPAMRDQAFDGEQIASTNAPEHLEAHAAADRVDAAWISAFDVTSPLAMSAPALLQHDSDVSGAAGAGAGAGGAGSAGSSEAGDQVLRLVLPPGRARATSFLAPLLQLRETPLPVWVRDVRVRAVADHFDAFLARPVASAAAERLVQFGALMAARSVSTYAWDKASGTRLGDPICDHYAARVAAGRQIYAVADGCGWGAAAARAAQAASRTFVNQLHARRSALVDLKSACLEVLLAMAEANVNVKRSTVSERPGTTTLVGGVLLRLDQPVLIGRPQKAAARSSGGAGGAPSEEAPLPPIKCGYAFVMASIGDVKVFHYNAATQQCADVSQHVVVDYAKFKSEDPGGRLGAQIDGEADLRNLAVTIVPCASGDAFAMLSDGVHDNLDPEKLGVNPPPHIGGGQWSALPLEAVDFIKRRFQRHFLEGVFRNAAGMVRSRAMETSPRDLKDRIGGHRGAPSRSRDVSPVHGGSSSSGGGAGGDVEEDEKKGRAALASSRKRTSTSSGSSVGRAATEAVPLVVNPATVTEELVAFARYVTKASRKFMFANPRLQLPNDFSILPGKQDHGTSLVFVVGAADNGSI